MIDPTPEDIERAKKLLSKQGLSTTDHLVDALAMEFLIVRAETETNVFRQWVKDLQDQVEMIANTMGKLVVSRAPVLMTNPPTTKATPAKAPATSASTPRKEYTQLDVVCPTCSAAPGRACTTIQGKSTLHQKREAASQARNRMARRAAK